MGSCMFMHIFATSAIGLRFVTVFVGPPDMPGFEGCVTQGCDQESFEMAKDLALSHPLLLVKH